MKLKFKKNLHKLYIFIKKYVHLTFINQTEIHIKAVIKRLPEAIIKFHIIDTIFLKIRKQYRIIYISGYKKKKLNVFNHWH